jgi:sec-independent protein translocase protein TatC
LRAHLREFRSRVIKAGLAIGAGSVAGWFAYDRLSAALTAPLDAVAKASHRKVAVNFQDLTSAFNLHVSLSLYLGLILSSPIWLYQFWAFLVPGLTRKERNYALAFVGASVPLFLTGIAMAWFALPNAARFLIGFAPANSTSYLSAQEYLDFVTRLMLAFGVAFVLPVLLVGLNMVGILSAKTLIKGWRVSVFLCFLFAAIASPTPDANSMIFLALPMVVLYFVAVGISWLNDRRRAKRDAAQGFGDLADDEASEITPTDNGDHGPDEEIDTTSDSLEASGPNGA